MDSQDHTPEAVLAFWFADAGDDAAAVQERNRVWFTSDPAFDEEIRRRFAALVESAQSDELKAWPLSAAGSLALVVICDQFPRNIYRSTPRAFALDPYALALARDAIAQGLDRQLSIVERSFLYLPFEHAEDRDAQAVSLRCFEQLHDEAPTHLRDYTADALHWSRDHHDIVSRFGRFPHRNLILDRVSSSAELEFLAAQYNNYGQG